MVDVSKIPDVAAVALLTLAFFSVARHAKTPISGLWLVGWLMIVLHFFAYLFLPAPGMLGIAADALGTSALVWAALLFMWACVPYRQRSSSRLIIGSLFATITLYLCLETIAPGGHGLLLPSAVLIGALPLTIALLEVGRFRHPLRWILVSLFAALSVFLLAVEDRPENGMALALNAVLFTVYLVCCMHFWYVYRRHTAGAFITVIGFLAWSSVFILGPAAQLFPSIHLEDEVWNLPKYVVAVGMILILLEDQIEHNKYLALHDELTGLPNRRLFQDRLTSALERARRTGRQAALLVIDLDYFKHVNDSVGHHMGDALLKHVSRLFLSRVRAADTVARTGGDEFSIVLEEPTGRGEALHVVKTLTMLLEAPVQIEGHSLRIGASVGVAVFPEDAANAEALFIAADLSMYASKRAARSKEGLVYPDPLWAGRASSSQT